MGSNCRQRSAEIGAIPLEIKLALLLAFYMKGSVEAYFCLLQGAGGKSDMLAAARRIVCSLTIIGNRTIGRNRQSSVAVIYDVRGTKIEEDAVTMAHRKIQLAWLLREAIRLSFCSIGPSRRVSYRGCSNRGT